MQNATVHEKVNTLHAANSLAIWLRRTLGAIPVSFTLHLADGQVLAIGSEQPLFALHVQNRRGLQAIRSLDELRVCEAYMDGDIDLEGDILRAIALRSCLCDQNLVIRLWRRLQPLLMGQAWCNKRWVQHHYDLENLQLHFLDSAYNTYTPGVFEREDEALEQASERKHRLTFEGLSLKPGDRILDVGFGWGSFLRYAARRGIHVTGVTLSRHQLHYVQAFTEREHLAAELHYCDFFHFEPEERFDAIVMMGVIEELADFSATMEHLTSLVKPGGRIYLDFMAAIEHFRFPAFISKYIYQGRTSRVYMPRFIAAVIASPFELIAVHNDRRNYYLTAKHWFERFEQQRDQIRRQFGERVYRMFRLYLGGTVNMLNNPDHFTTAYRVFLELPRTRFSHGIGSNSTA